MSKPSSSGRCTHGEANVLSATVVMPRRRAIAATASRSTSFSSGFDGDSTQIMRVSGVSAASSASARSSGR